MKTFAQASKREIRELMRRPWSRFQPAVPTTQAPPGCRMIWINNRYSVQVYPRSSGWGDITHLIVRRHDGAAVHDWADLQRIKNEILGPDRTAVEVYPAQNNLVDDAHLYHLWVLPAGFELPFGLHLSSTPKQGGS